MWDRQFELLTTCIEYGADVQSVVEMLGHRGVNQCYAVETMLLAGFPQPYHERICVMLAAYAQPEKKQKVLNARRCLIQNYDSCWLNNDDRRLLGRSTWQEEGYDNEFDWRKGLNRYLEEAREARLEKKLKSGLQSV